MDIKNLESFLKENNQPTFRLKQIQKAVYQDGASAFSEITSLSKDLREKLDQEIEILSFETVQVLQSKDGESIKALLKLNDGNFTETVLIAPKPGTWSACISSQVGCPMGCKFCATGKMGLKRNLTSEEITDQVLFWRQWLRKNSSDLTSKPHPALRATFSLERRRGKLSNIVYMGMGEPFLNWDQVRESLQILTDKNLFGFGSRSISVSTSGIPEGVAKLAEEFPQVNLALSLHFADDKKRSEIMPVNRKNNLESLKKSIQNYFQKTKRKIFLEYIMLDKINDSRQDADNLIKFIRSIGNVHLLHVNLIRHNPTGSEFKASEKNRAQDFKNYLLKNHIGATIRKSAGDEIAGACGQLAGKL